MAKAPMCTRMATWRVSFRCCLAGFDIGTWDDPNANASKTENGLVEDPHIFYSIYFVYTVTLSRSKVYETPTSF